MTKKYIAYLPSPSGNDVPLAHIEADNKKQAREKATALIQQRQWNSIMNLFIRGGRKVKEVEEE